MASSEASRAASLVLAMTGVRGLMRATTTAVGEARGDAVGDVEGGGALGDFADGAVGKLDLD